MCFHQCPVSVLLVTRSPVPNVGAAVLVLPVPVVGASTQCMPCVGASMQLVLPVPNVSEYQCFQ